MVFLKMIGAVSAESYAKMVKERDDALADADKAAGSIARQLGTISTLQHNAGLDRAAIEKQSAEMVRLSRGWDKCGDELNQAKLERDALQRAVDKLNAENGRLVNDYAERGDIMAAKSNEVRALDAEVAELTRQLTNFRAKRDRDNAQRRERHARKANDAAPKAKKGVR